MKPRTTSLNELTFVARLGATTRIWSEARRSQGLAVVIATGDIEEREIDPVTDRVLRCDMRLNSLSGQKLVSGEFKRPEVAEGKDPRHEHLRADARRKAVARGLLYYFTCNLARLVLYSLPTRRGEVEREVREFNLADISRSQQAESVWPEIEGNWEHFLDYLESLLEVVVTQRPSVSHETVVDLKYALDGIVEECKERVRDFLLADPSRIEEARQTAANAYGFPVALNPSKPAQFADELVQILRLGGFVVAQKLILRRTLSEVGPKRRDRFHLDPLTIPSSSTNPELVRQIIGSAVQQAIQRSKDYETAFLPTPHEDLLFCPVPAHRVEDCRIGVVWAHLVTVVEKASWAAISQNLVGFLYETIIEPKFRRELGQFYTRADVVDLLTTFAVRSKEDLVLDPAAGGGSFLRSAYQRKVDMDATHEEALAETWGCEITTFAAQLSSISLATANTEEPAAYPRVLLKDFFTLRPGCKTILNIPGEGLSRFPGAFDAIVGNPPYISYRHQMNQSAVADSLTELGKRSMKIPAFSGKSDEYVWFIVHSSQFLKAGGRLAFVVSSAILFSDYGIPLIRFLGRYFRIVAVVDSLVEQWFEDADTNTVLLLLEREEEPAKRADNDVRFIRFRRPLAHLLPEPDADDRRAVIENLAESLVTATADGADYRFQVNLVKQGQNGGLEFEPLNDSLALMNDDDGEEES